MASAISILSKYVVLPGVIGYALMKIAAPSEEEIKKIQDFNSNDKSQQFAAVLRAAANPNAKPMYRQKPGEQHPIPELAHSAQTKR